MSQVKANVRLRLHKGSEVLEQAVRLECGGRLVANHLNGIIGPGGVGKTFIVLYIAAIFSTGRAFYGDVKGDNPANVLFVSAEDGAGDTIVPRFKAIGGDPERLFISNATIITDADGNEIPGSLSLQQVDAIRDAIREVRPSLLIVDPVTGFLGPNVNMNHATDVRPILERISQIAEEEAVTVLFVMHVNKSSMHSSQAAYRALGSVDFVNVARSVLIAEEHEGKKILAHAKFNLGEKAPSLMYDLEDSDYTLGGKPVAKIAWKGTSDLTAEDLVHTSRSRGGPTEAFQPEELDDKILESLSQPLTAKTLERDICNGLGVPRYRFEEARARLRERGAIAYRRHGFEPGSTYYWYRTDRPVPWEEAE